MGGQDGQTKVFNLRLLAVVDTLSTDVRAYGMSIQLDGADTTNLQSTKIATKITAYNDGSQEIVTAEQYGGSYFVYVHIRGITVGDAAMFTVSSYTQMNDDTVFLDTAYEFTPSHFVLEGWEEVTYKPEQNSVSYEDILLGIGDPMN